MADRKEFNVQLPLSAHSAGELLQRGPRRLLEDSCRSSTFAHGYRRGTLDAQSSVYEQQGWATSARVSVDSESAGACSDSRERRDRADFQIEYPSTGLKNGCYRVQSHGDNTRIPEAQDLRRRSTPAREYAGREVCPCRANSLRRSRYCEQWASVACQRAGESIRGRHALSLEVSGLSLDRRPRISLQTQRQEAIFQFHYSRQSLYQVAFLKGKSVGR